MPFLKAIKTSYAKRKIENAKRNGLRYAIFSPVNKQPFKGYYIGEWKNDIKGGRGKELDRHGWIYQGHWYNDKRHGCGTLSKISKEEHAIHRRYLGEWFAGKKQGFGHNWFKDGSYYEGAFCRNKRHGYGRIWYCNGDYYEGGWEDDLYHGMGIFVKDNGNKYEGQFVKGKKEGHGIFYHIVTGQEQRGLWRSDFFINGTMVDADYRQSAASPTPYPIPPVRLATLVETSQGTSDTIDDDLLTESTPVEHTCKRRRKRIIPNLRVSVNTCPCIESISLTNEPLLYNDV